MLIIGAILYVTGVLDGSRAALLGFCLALMVSVLAGVIFTLKKLLLSDGVKKSKGVQIIAPSDNGSEQSDRGGSGNSFDGESGKRVDEITRVERGSETPRRTRRGWPARSTDKFVSETTVSARIPVSLIITAI